MESSENNKLTLEQKIEQVNQITKELEEEDITLEKSFALYESGVQLIRQINEEIDKVEKKMQVLNEQGELEEF